MSLPAPLTYPPLRHGDTNGNLLDMRDTRTQGHANPLAAPPEHR